MTFLSVKALCSKNGRHSQRGSAILFLFVAVALFGALGYAFLQGTRGNTNIITAEAEKAATYQTQDCTNTINMAVKRLQARGCAEMVSHRTDGSNTRAGAPTDGSCSVFHPNGGGVKTGCASGDGCVLTELAIGETCGGVVYAGVSGGNRIYAAPTDAGAMSFNSGIATIHTPGFPTGRLATVLQTPIFYWPSIMEKRRFWRRRPAVIWGLNGICPRRKN